MRPDSRQSILRIVEAASPSRGSVRFAAGTPLLRIICLLVVLASNSRAIENSDCLVCHSDQTLTRTNAAANAVSLFVDEQVYKTSVHGSLGCTDCHTSIKDIPHQENLPDVNCASCHEAVGKEYATSIHGVSRAMGASGAATCKDCHGTHHVLPVKHPDSPVFKLNLPGTCGK